MDDLRFLSKNLKVIVDYEISIGNEIRRIDRPAGTKCPLAVVFKKPLNFNGFLKINDLASGIERWDNKDRHYDQESGYVCGKTRQAITAPSK